MSDRVDRVVCINLGEGSFAYDTFQYPAGEWQVRLRPEMVNLLRESDKVRITARLRSGDDLMKLLLLEDAVEGVIAEETSIHLILPYLPYGRADRRFVSGDCHGARVFEYLLSPYFNSIWTLDKHNLTSPLGVRNVPPTDIIYRAASDFARRFGCFTILFPDEGARKRYNLSWDVVGNNHEAFGVHYAHATKIRDSVTGELKGFDVPEIKGPTLIVDDICDGGGTFVGIAKSGKINDGPKGLYVTHGIFSKGVEVLTDLFDRVYTTDSYQNVAHPRVRVFTSYNVIAKAISSHLGD